ncbi:hypothetical protein [Sphingomonas sp.]|uniref:hypothetical protein n=1 Tax=Sphingomonas sp. TaxID=28214 RepID=UPI002DD64F26|nr:hypothetical protein [Sphingomonas sp.]
MFSLMLLAMLAAGDPTAAVPAPAKPAKEDKIICRYIETTGSRVAGERVCMAKSQWTRAAQATSEGLGRAIDSFSAQGVKVP